MNFEALLTYFFSTIIFSNILLLNFTWRVFFFFFLAPHFPIPSSQKLQSQSRILPVESPFKTPSLGYLLMIRYCKKTKQKTQKSNPPSILQPIINNLQGLFLWRRLVSLKTEMVIRTPVLANSIISKYNPKRFPPSKMGNSFTWSFG